MEAARLATPEDLPRLVELDALAAAELRPMRGGELWFARRQGTPADRRLEAALADSEQRVLAGTIDEAVVGYAVARVEPLSEGRPLGVVEDLFVEEGAREVGLGEALMNELLRWFRERGCRGVDAIALPGHRAAKNFFEESGFTARLLVMHTALDEPPP